MSTQRDLLLAEYKKLAKRADQRLVRLERAAIEREHFQNVKQFAYKDAMYDIKTIAGENATRFNVKLPADFTERDIVRSINKVQSFLNKKTSTVAAINKAIINRGKNMNKKFGLDFSWEEWANILESGAWDALDEKFGYLTAMNMVKRRTRNKPVKSQIARVNDNDLESIVADIMKIDLDVGGL